MSATDPLRVVLAHAPARLLGTAAGGVSCDAQRVAVAVAIDRLFAEMRTALEACGTALGESAMDDERLSHEAKGDLVLAATFVKELAARAEETRATLRRRVPGPERWGEVLSCRSTGDRHRRRVHVFASTCGRRRPRTRVSNRTGSKSSRRSSSTIPAIPEVGSRDRRKRRSGCSRPIRYSSW